MNTVIYIYLFEKFCPEQKVTDEERSLNYQDNNTITLKQEFTEDPIEQGKDALDSLCSCYGAFTTNSYVCDCVGFLSCQCNTCSMATTDLAAQSLLIIICICKSNKMIHE